MSLPAVRDWERVRQTTNLEEVLGFADQLGRVEIKAQIVNTRGAFECDLKLRDELSGGNYLSFKGGGNDRLSAVLAAVEQALIWIRAVQ